MKKIFILIMLMLVTAAGFGQAITTYTGSGGSSTAVTANNANVTVTAIQSSGFGSNNACTSGGLSGITVNTTWTAYSTGGPRVFYKITPNTGFQITVTSISAVTRESGTGPTKGRPAYSLDNGATWVSDGLDHGLNAGGSCGASSASLVWSGLSVSNITTNGIIVAVFPYAPGSSSGTFQINSLIVNGTVTAVSPPSVQPITGTTTVCQGGTTQLSDATASGSWSSSNTAVATISSSGVVNAVAAGTTTITYAVGTLSATTTVTVAAKPTVTAISATVPTVCVGSTLALSDATTVGVWSSSDITKATINTSGVVIGVTPGGSVIKYLVVNASSCRDSALYPVIINDTPSFSIVAGGPTTFCNGSSVTLTATPHAAATPNNAVQLTGTTSNTATSPYISAPVLPAFYDNFTIECWVNPTSTIAIPSARNTGTDGIATNAHYVLFPTWGGTSTNNSGAVATGAGAGLSVGTNGVVVYEHANAYLPALLVWNAPITGWTHIAVVYNNKQPSLYINGQYDTTGLISTAGHVYPSLGQFPVSSFSFLYGGIGGGYYGGSFPGQIDEFRIWSVARSATDISSNYNKIITTPATNLFAYYRFSEGTGTTVADASGNANTAVFHNNVSGNPTWITTGPTLINSGSSSTPDPNAYLWSPGGAATAAITATAAGTYTVTATNPSGCMASSSQKITITPDATISLSSATGTDGQSPCVNTPITTITYAIGGSGNNASVSGLPAGVTYFFAAGVLVITGTPTASGTFNYTATAIGTCAPATITGTITVKQDATISLSSATGTDGQSVCINNPLTNITYTIGGTGGNATITAGTLPAGVTGAYNSSTGVYTISGTPTVSGIFPYTITATGGCAPATISGTITVKQDATISLSSAANTDNQLGCSGTAIVTITYNIGGAGTGATVTGLPTGLTTAYAAGVFTISGIPTVTGIFPYTITTTGSGCINPSLSGTITINTAPVVAPVSGPATVCPGATIPLTDVTPGGVWSSDNTAIARVDNSGIVTGVTPGIASITYSVTNNCTTTPSTAYQVTVIGKPPVAPVTGTAEVCVGGSLTLNDATPGGVWSSSNTGIATINSGGAITNFTAGNVMIAYTVTGTCSDSSALYAVTIDPKPSLTVSADTIICTNGQATLRAQTDASSSIQWSGTGSNANPAVVTPAITTTYNVTATSNKGCTSNGSVKVTVEDFSLTLTANPNPVVIGSSLTLTTSSPLPYQVISWQPAYLFSNQTAVSQTLTGDSTRQYIVTAKTSEGCIDKDSVKVIATTNEYDLYIPNYLSPNGDGKNDVVYVRGSVIKSLEWRIYNQLGTLIFESTDQNKGWDGTYKGTQQPVGVYVYVLKVTLQNGSVFNKKGSITLIR